MTSLIKNRQLFTLQLYNFLRQGSLLLISIFLAKGNADIEKIAGFETAMLLSASFSFFTIAALGHCLYPLMSEAMPIEKPQYYLHAFLLFCLSGILAALCVWVSAYFLFDHYFSFHLFIYPATYILFNAGTYFTDHYFVIENKLKAATTWGLSSFLIQIVLICYPLIYLHNLEMALFLLSSFAAIRFIFTALLIRKITNSIQFNPVLLFKMIKRSWPVMLSLLLGSGFSYINQYWVKNGFDATSFALFRYGTREFPLFAILTNSFSSLFSGTYASSSQKDHTDSIRRLSHQVFIPAILLMWFSQPLFKIFFNEVLAESWIFFNILLLIVPSKLVFPQSVLLAEGKSNFLLLASLIEIIIGVMLTFLFIPMMGISGAVYALTAAYIAEKAALTLFCRFNQIPIGHFADLKSLIPYTLILITSFILAL